MFQNVWTQKVLIVTLSENHYFILIICNGFIGIFNLDIDNSTYTYNIIQINDDKL